MAIGEVRREICLMTESFFIITSGMYSNCNTAATNLILLCALNKKVLNMWYNTAKAILI